jgi:hypothetical protein
MEWTLEPGERVLAEAALPAGRAAATTRRLLAQADDGTQVAGEWTDIEHVRWAGGRLTIEWNHGPAATSLELGKAGRRLASAVNEQVTRSVIIREHVAAPGGTVRLAIRRRPDGELFSQVVAPSAVDLGDPATAERVARAEAQLREAAALA